MVKRLSILGTRGIPSCHGGFETFAEKLALFLVAKGWHITIYCQIDGNGDVTTDTWRGVHRVNISVMRKDAMGTVLFDWKSTLHAMRKQGLILTLGYNTAVFCLLYRLFGKINLINMDGLEWQRKKWSTLGRGWLYLNERIGCLLSNHLVADHPEIKRHLVRVIRVNPEKVTMIPYGSDRIDQTDITQLEAFGLTANSFCTVIARPEPENLILEIVQAFSAKTRNHKLVVLGEFFQDGNEYHRSVLNAASEEVIFPGAIYDKSIVNALRFYSRLYVHGHTVGGTNPSLVEALGAGSAVLAHNNRFNRWVAGDGALYFSDKHTCSDRFDSLLESPNQIIAMKEASRTRHTEMFTWDHVLSQYEDLLKMKYSGPLSQENHMPSLRG